MPSQLRCGLGLGVTILSVVFILIALSPGVGVASCECTFGNMASLSPSSWDHGDKSLSLLCATFVASLSNIARGGDDLILFVYWILVMVVALLCLRIAGLITFFHSDEAEQCFYADIFVNMVCGVMVSVALVLIITWTGRSNQCNMVNIAENWFSAVSLLVVSVGIFGLVAIIDVITILVPADMMYFYSPVLSMTQDSGAHINLGVQGRRELNQSGSGDNTQMNSAVNTVDGVPSSSSANAIKPVYTIDDEVDVEHNKH